MVKFSRGKVVLVMQPTECLHKSLIYFSTLLLLCLEVQAQLPFSEESEVLDGVQQYIQQGDHQQKKNQVQQHYKPHHPEKSKEKAVFERDKSTAAEKQVEPWGYGPENGPAKWQQACQTGQRQSPVDIRARDVDVAYLDALHFQNYNKAGRVVVKNTGHGVQVEGFTNWNTSDQPFIVGGGLEGKYLLSQFHFHWSVSHHNGSEHTIGQLHYPVEVHLVHTKEGYSSTQITSEPDGLAVVGIFLNVGTDETALATLTSALDHVVDYGNSTQIFDYRAKVNLPEDTENFYRYNGSLTTPGCNEAVIWTVMAEPISITKTQLKVLQTVRLDASNHADFNNRPTRPLSGRRILYRSPSLNKEKICKDVRSGSLSKKIFSPYNLALLAIFLILCTMYKI